jgi:hypothetical protein
VACFQIVVSSMVCVPLRVPCCGHLFVSVKGVVVHCALHAANMQPMQHNHGPSTTPRFHAHAYSQHTLPTSDIITLDLLVGFVCLFELAIAVPSPLRFNVHVCVSVHICAKFVLGFKLVLSHSRPVRKSEAECDGGGR